MQRRVFIVMFSIESMRFAVCDEKGNCWNNVSTESFLASLKC